MWQEQSKRYFKDRPEVSANKKKQKSKTTNCADTAGNEQLSTLNAGVRSYGHDSIQETQTTDCNPKEENANEKINENDNSFVVLNKRTANTSRCKEAEYKSTNSGRYLNRDDVEQTFQDVQETKPKKGLNRGDVEQTFKDVQNTKRKKEISEGRKDTAVSSFDEDEYNTIEQKYVSQNRTNNKTKINNKASLSSVRQNRNKHASDQRNQKDLLEEFNALNQKQMKHEQQEPLQPVAMRVCKVMPHSVVSSTKEILKWLFLIVMLSSYPNKEPSSQLREHKTFYNLERKSEMSLSYQDVILGNIQPYEQVWQVFAIGDDCGYDPEVWLFASREVITSILLGQERDRHLRLGAFRLATFGFYMHACMRGNAIELAREGYFCDLDGQVRCYQCFSLREAREGSSQTAHCPIAPDHQVNSIDNYGIGINALLPGEPVIDLHTTRQDTRLAYASTGRGVVQCDEGSIGRGSTNRNANTIPRAWNIPPDDPMNQMFEEWLQNNDPSNLLQDGEDEETHSEDSDGPDNVQN